MNTDLLSTEQLRDRVEKTWLQHIKLCQDNFMYFVKEVWPEFIYRKTKDESRWVISFSKYKFWPYFFNKI